MNIINAIINLVNNPVTELTDVRNGNNRANNAGEALEIYVKNLFAGSFGMPILERNRQWNRVFSYLGNSANPPDIMLRGGDAIEVKKIENPTAPLALNSSYPKHTLRADSQFISQACKDAERWTEKDMIYTVGYVLKNTMRLRSLIMVYGLDYCASQECYLRIRRLIKEGVESAPGIEFTESKELGHINRIDPLGITYMRVRGMYGIDNPWSTFNYLWHQIPRYGDSFNFAAIIDDVKWDEFENTEDLLTLSESVRDLNVFEVEVHDPDNPAILRGAKLVTYELD